MICFLIFFDVGYLLVSLHDKINICIVSNRASTNSTTSNGTDYRVRRVRLKEKIRQKKRTYVKINTIQSAELTSGHRLQ